MEWIIGAILLAAMLVLLWVWKGHALLTTWMDMQIDKDARERDRP